MNCKKARQLLSLMVGSDLSQRKLSAVKSHLETCSRCQLEYESYILSLKKMREWLGEDRIDWEENEWLNAVQRATKQKIPGISTLIPWPFKRIWAYSVMALVAVVITLFVVWPNFIKQEERVESGISAGFQRQAEMPKQEVVSMTIVSKETGLKIAWFFNKNFKLEDKK